MITQELLPESASSLYEQLQSAVQGLPVEAVAGIVEALLITSTVVGNPDLEATVVEKSQLPEFPAGDISSIVRQLRS